MGVVPLLFKSYDDEQLEAPSLEWWEVVSDAPIAVYTAKNAASKAASQVNLINPGTYDLTSAAEPGWNSLDGWIGNGTTQYWDTNMGADVENIKAAICRFSARLSTGYLCGISQTGLPNLWFFMSPYAGPGNTLYGTEASSALGGAGIDGGTLGIDDLVGYRNGLLDATIPPSIGGASSLTHGIFAVNDSASGPGFTGFLQVNIQAIGFWSDLSNGAADILALHNSLMEL